MKKDRAKNMNAKTLLSYLSAGEVAYEVDQILAHLPSRVL
jgi:hypothetical protein